jgi:DNA-3-methyladenine glycosylase II
MAARKKKRLSHGTWDAEAAIAALGAADPVLKRAIREHGPFLLPRRHATPFEMLAEAVIHQQLSTKAAATIAARLKAALAGAWNPEALLAAEEQAVRAAGLSRAKAAAVRAIAASTLDGTIPALAALRAMTDEAIAERLISVKGIGPWTVHMFLIFSLRRPDVMPAHDLGIRKGFQRLYGIRALPSPERIVKHAERWRPYRTVASWYLWRCANAP